MRRFIFIDEDGEFAGTSDSEEVADAARESGSYNVIDQQEPTEEATLESLSLDDEDG